MIEKERDFYEWLDTQLDEEIPKTVVAFNINLYESPFNIEIVGSNEFKQNDEDWACNEDWVPKNRSVPVSARIFGSSWEEAQSNVLNMAKGFINSTSKNAAKLRVAKAFAVGFVDGNLEYVQ